MLKFLQCALSLGWLTNFSAFVALLLIFQFFDASNGLFLQKRLILPSDSKELPNCAACKSYFKEVIRKLPDNINKNPGLQIFRRVLKKECENFEKEFASCQNIVDYVRAPYQIWLLIRYNDNIQDKSHRLCYNEHFCQFERPQNEISDIEFEKLPEPAHESRHHLLKSELKKPNKLLVQSTREKPNYYYDYYI